MKNVKAILVAICLLAVAQSGLSLPEYNFSIAVCDYIGEDDIHEGQLTTLALVVGQAEFNEAINAEETVALNGYAVFRASNMPEEFAAFQFDIKTFTGELNPITKEYRFSIELNHEKDLSIGGSLIMDASLQMLDEDVLGSDISCVTAG